MKTSATLVLKNTLYNILGKVLPFIIALVSIPILISYLGTDRFGILTLTWVFVGYFSLFDLGLGRAIVKTVAERVGTNNESDIYSIFRLTSSLLGLLGILAGAVLFLTTPVLVTSVLNIPEEYVEESILALYYLSLALPFTLLSTAFRGILEAWQKFGMLNIVQSSIGTLTYVVPVLVVFYEPRLDYVVASLALIRIAGSGMFLYFAKKQINKVEKPVEKNDGLLKELLGFGGWVTVSNILDPLLNYLDRFVIGSLLSMSAVAYFTTPFEVTTKLVVIPAALIASLFPALSNLAVLAPERLKTMIGDSYHFLVAITFLICFTGIMGSELFLHYWIDEEFARESTFILQIFLLGFFVNSLAKIPFSHLQSIGKPDITAKIHLAEAPFTILFIFLGAIYYGIVGVALVRFFRVLVDMVLLMLFSSRFIENLKMPFKRIFFHLGVLICAVLATMLKPGLLITAGTIVLGGLIYLIYFWFASEERHKNYLGNLSSNLFG